MKFRISRSSWTLLAGASLGFAALASLVPALASCADSNETDSSDDGGTVISAPDTGAGSAIDASEGDTDADTIADAGCEAGDPRCTTTKLSCSNTDWCPVDGAVDPRVALTSIWGSGANDVWAVGTAGNVVHWDGASWKPQPVTTGGTLFAVWGSGPNDIWTVSSFKDSYRGQGEAEDGGTTWAKLPALPFPYTADFFPALTSVWGSSPTNVWIGGGDKIAYPALTKIWRTKFEADGGLSWATHTPCTALADCPGVRALWGSAESDVWLVGDRGRTYHTTGVQADGGVPFTVVETQTTNALRSVWGSDASHVWAVGDDGTIRQFSGGAVWNVIESPVVEDLRGVWGSSANDVWAVGSFGTIIHWDGTKWETSSAAFAAGPTPTLYGIWGSGPNDVWIVGEGVVLHYTGKGRKVSGR